MNQEDFARLKTDIQKNGFDDKYPIYLYEGKVLDGWNRYSACQQLNVVPKYTTFTGTSIDAIMFVMRTNKRRNLNSGQWAAMAVEAEELIDRVKRAVEEEAKKKMAEAKIGNENALKENQPRQLIDRVVLPSNSNKEIAIAQLTVEQPKQPTQKIVEVVKNPTTKTTPIRTDQKIAEMFNTNRTYINEAARIKVSNPDAFEAIKRGEKTLPSVAKEIRQELNKPHVSNNSGENEWYTPSNIIELARKVMGSIDLDPASSELANKTVRANVFFTMQDNGLVQKWSGNVWMNPPYAQPLIGNFCNKLVEEFGIGNINQAIVLVNNATDTAWFHRLVIHSGCVCFTKGRMRFIHTNGNPGAPLQGQAILYFGDNVGEFMNLFEKIGFMLLNPLT